MKKFLAALLLGLFLVSIVGCGTSETQQEQGFNDKSDVGDEKI